MLYAEQKAHELRREIAVTDDILRDLGPLLGRPGMPETRTAYEALLSERARLCGQLEVAEIAILSGACAPVSGRA
jgi:hypothetical protein